MKKLVIASRNQGKIAEFRRLLAGHSFQVFSLEDFPEIPEIEETGVSFRDNAFLKARAVAAVTGSTVLADDSGLQVDYLKGDPGVYSSRYAGPEGDPAKNNSKLLSALAGVPWEKRTACFKCVIVIITEKGQDYVCEGTCRGFIATRPRGATGFGYDPLFLVAGLDKTFAELAPEVKNKISHRGQAMRLAKQILAQMAEEA